MSENPDANEVVESVVRNLAELVDATALQSMMDDFYELTSIPMSLIDLAGNIVVGAGWQRVCIDFHRANPLTCAHCIESDTALTTDIEPGEARLYRCKNGMWDAAMPVIFGSRPVANVFTGQFFFDDETIDMDFFRAQASKYGFAEEEYLEAIMNVPRLSREAVNAGLSFLSKFANMLSRLTLANRDLDDLVHERQALLVRERGQSERLRVLAEVEAALMSSLHISEVIGMALSSAETHLGVVASSIWALDEKTNRLHIIGSAGFPAEFRDDFDNGVDIDEAYPVARAARLDETILYGSVADSSLHRPVYDAYARYGIDLGALAAVPLKARGGVVGSMTLAWQNQVDFNDDDITLVETLASRFAAALENARLFEAEHMIAETLQETLVVLPERVPGVHYSRAYQSATYEHGRVGGDFVDIFPVEGPVVGITLGDVSGKGLDAAVTTSLIRTALRTHAIDGLGPAAVMAKTNRVMRRFSDIETFATVWFGLLHTETGHLRYVSAGHPAGLVCSPAGEVNELQCLHPILGAFDNASYSECATVLASGDRLILYSDGVTESRSPEGDFLGPEALFELIHAYRDVETTQLSEALMADVVGYGGGMLRDDAAILVVESCATDTLP